MDEEAIMDMGELESKEDKYEFKYEVNRLTTDKDEMSTKERELQNMRKQHIHDFPEIFGDSLDGTHMNVLPVNIELKQSGVQKPKSATNPHKVPVFWRPSATDMRRSRRLQTSVPSQPSS